MSETSTGLTGLTGHQLVRRRTQRYFETLRWLVTNLFLFRPMPVLFIVGLITAGRSLQAAAFAGLIWFFSAAERNTPIDLMGLSVDPRSGQWMALMLAGVAMAMITATFVIYLSARLGFYLSVAFAENLVKSVMNLEGAYPTRAAIAQNGQVSHQVQEVTNGKPMLFRPVYVLLTLPRHILLVIPAIAGMIWIAGEVVAFLAVLATPAVALNYVISRRVVVAQKSRFEVNRNYRQAMRDTLNAFSDESQPMADRASLADDLMASPANKASVGIFTYYVLSPRQSEFVSNVLASIAVAAIGLYLGYEALSGVIPLAQVIGFFVMLRVAISGLTGSTVSLTTYARFYGLIRSTFDYLTSPLKDAGKFTGKPVLHAAKQDEPPPGTLGTDVPVQRGEPVAIVSPAKVNRYTQYFFAFALTQRARQSTREKLNAAALRCTAALAEPGRLAAHGLLALTQDDLDARLKDTGLAEIAPSIDAIRQAAKDGAGPPPAVASRIALLTAVVSEADFIIVDRRVLAPLPKGESKHWLAALEDRFIAVAYRLQRFDGCIAGESHAILLDTERAVAVVEADNAADAARAVEAVLKEAGDDAMEVFEAEMG
ncbi:hypothetical protein [Microbaculum sp. FT89]|uniref:hypothetical protein n=1 Tax=Microbaculum sp. FT89 TaxID=3447298 RepID=UPI003F52CD78